MLSQLPWPPARVLEVGCGSGDLARALEAAGHAVTAIDPEAPEGPLFRRVTLEAFAERGPFDAVIASRSLHHVADLGAALDKIAGLLRRGGILVLSEYAKERFDAATARWYYERRQTAGTGPPTLEECLRECEDQHADIHGYGPMRAELDRRFAETFFAWIPYLYRELGAETEAVERSLAEAGAIHATGFLYVGKTAAR